MNPLTPDQWSTLRGYVLDRSRECAVTWLRNTTFLPEDVCLSCVKLVENEYLAACWVLDAAEGRIG